MHHLPAGPPLSARLRGATARWLLLLRRALHGRSGRLALGALVSAGITAVLVCVPVVSGSSEPTPPVSLDASASSSGSSSGGSPVVMGQDGKPITSAAFAGLTSEVTYSAAPVVEAAGSASTAGHATGSTPLGSSGRPTAAGTGGSGATGTTGSSGTGTPTVAAGSPSTSSGSTSSGSTSSGSTSSDPTTEVDTPSQPEPAPPATQPAPQSVQEQLLALVNSARAGRGCAALVPDGALASAAQAHSADMQEAGLLSLAGGPLLDLGGRAAVAHGPADPATVLQGWLADPTDAEALLDCGAGTGGVGIADGGDGPWWTLLLG